MARSYFNANVAQRGIGSPWDVQIRQAALANGLDPALIKGVISAESEWNPVAVSFNNSSFGLMQINVAAHGITVAQANDPNWAIPYATALLLHQIQTRPSLDLALAAYNAGTSRTNADLQNRLAGDINGVGTYVRTVLDYFAWFQANDAAPAVPIDVVITGPDLTTPPADGGAGVAGGFRGGPSDGRDAARQPGQPDPARSVDGP
jgi:soluble lytic murein transglycosylase-like protein